MAAIAKTVYSAFNQEKPHSSITQWIEILTSNTYEDEAYDGIPEIVDSINLQPTGPGEASRAIRKKLKHGTAHNQYRALVILQALVQNGGTKFQKSFSDSQLIDAIKHMADDSTTDPKVKKRLMVVLASWHQQFKDDPSMSLVSGLYKPYLTERKEREASIAAEQQRKARMEELERKRIEEREAKEEAKRRVKEDREAERLRKLKAEEDARRAKNRPKRKPFIFEQEKPNILASIATASQASSNLVNAITLVNTANDSLQTNTRVQECLVNAKDARKKVVRYIQLVENEELIGTLIETNERIIAALETYDTLSKPNITEQDVEDAGKRLARANIHDSELSKLQDKQRAAVQRAVKGGSSRGKERDRSDAPRRSTRDYSEERPSGHPDLQDLSFGSSLGAAGSKLPPPIRPDARRLSDGSDYDSSRGASLSDYSDYESSDEEAHARRASTSSSRRAYLAQDGETPQAEGPKKGLLEEDPFADPFVDQEEVETPDVAPVQGMRW